MATEWFRTIKYEAISPLSSPFLRGDGNVDISDPVYSLSFLFMGGPVPVEPFGDCGVDLTEDELDCESFNRCQ